MEYVDRKKMILERMDRIDTKFTAFDSVEGNCYELDMIREDLIAEKSELSKMLREL